MLQRSSGRAFACNLTDRLQGLRQSVETGRHSLTERKKAASKQSVCAVISTLRCQ